ncbi:EamA family transporter RarD [Kytococcus schroeteri]|uniref:EamA family transporter RarD n=1 Tax=Kytococcus schroeteri TaxID=138300 RepID=UPI0035EFE1CC
MSTHPTPAPAAPTGGDPAAATPAGTPSPAAGRGVLYGFGAYLLWGAFPLYFAALAPAGPWEILAHRVVWSLLFCLVLLAATRQLGALRGVLGTRRRALAMTAAGLTIGVNWTIYVTAVTTGHVTEAALGYFLNPLATVVIGVVVLRESLRRWQWVAVGIAAAAAVYLTVDYGQPPWISLALALSFATYGLLKKQVGASVPALHSLTAETVALLPVATGILVWLGTSPTGSTTTHQTFTGHGVGHMLWLASAGVATAIPLLLFAAAASRVTLVTIGLLQFLTPVLQLLVGVLVMGEHLSVSRWIGFAMVWCALVVLMTDTVVAAGRRRRHDRLARAAGGLSGS